jgi:hypothetical protein
MTVECVGKSAPRRHFERSDPRGARLIAGREIRSEFDMMQDVAKADVDLSRRHKSRQLSPWDGHKV